VADVPRRLEEFRFREPRQERIHRRLLLIGQNAAAFYRDVCRLVDGTAQIETAAHTLGHNLREIESALQHVLLPLVAPEVMAEAKKRYPGKKTGHLVKVQAILHTLGLAEVPEAAETWRKLANPDGEAGLARLAHRDALGRPRPLSEAVLQFVDDVQALFDVALARFEDVFANYFRELDRLLATPVPTAADVDTLRNKVPNTHATFAYFFDHLAHPAWVVPLRKEGFFSNPPDPVPHEGGGRSFAFWPALRYLVRMAGVPRVQETVLEIATSIPHTENVRVHEDLADLALALSPALAAQLVPMAKEWTQSPYHMLLPEKLGDLVSHLARAGLTDAARELASVLLDVQPDPRAPMTTPDGEIWPLEACAHFDLWRYEQVLKKNLPDLIEAAGAPAFDTLGDILERAVRLSRSREEVEGPEDYSYIWRPSIADHSQNHVHTLRDALITAVRDAAEALGGRNPAYTIELVQNLLARPWRVFHRIALHLLRLFRDGTLSIAGDCLLDRERFDTLGLRPEYRLLLRDRWGELPDNARAVILGWVEAGPHFDVRDALERMHGRPPADDEVRRAADAWRVDHLALLVPVLDEESKRKYQGWLGDAPESEHPEFAVHSTGWHGSTSPVSAAELLKMSVEEVVDLLRSWVPGADWMGPSRDGLEAVLTAAVTAEPGRFAADVVGFKDIEPGYVTALLWGFRAAVKEHPGWPWGPVLDVCRWAADQTDPEPEATEGQVRLDRSARSLRKAVASLLEEGLSASDGQIPLGLRSELWSVLERLSHDPDPTVEDEARHGGDAFDPVNYAINTVRGDAIHGVVRYALWVRRHTETEADGKARLARGFEEMPEVRAVLDEHLAVGVEPSRAIRAIFGQWFPWLVLLDAQWAAAHAPLIFPVDPTLASYREAAWNAYIRFSDPYDNVFPLLKDEYRAAAERSSAWDPKRATHGDSDSRLGEHLMTFYARGKLPLGKADNALGVFFSRAPVGLRRHALASVGIDLGQARGLVRPEIKDRLMKLWAWRIEEVRTASDPRQAAEELGAFGWWFVSGAFDDEWAIGELTETLPIGGKVDAHHDVMAKLAALPGTMAARAVTAARLLVEADQDGWVVLVSKDAIKTIIVNACDVPGAREAAGAFVGVLSARGYPEFRELLK
jgi:hypothetical protein